MFIWTKRLSFNRSNDFSNIQFSSVQFRSVTQLCLTLCDPKNCSTPGLPVHHQLPEFTQTHVHRVSDAIQPSHPLSSPSPPAPNPSQHRSFPMSRVYKIYFKASFISPLEVFFLLLKIRMVILASILTFLVSSLSQTAGLHPIFNVLYPISAQLS